MIQTSPIPEDAPVMSTTLPATFSLYMDLFKEKRYLRKRNGGIKIRMVVSVKRRNTVFKNLWSKSIERERWNEDMGIFYIVSGTRLYSVCSFVFYLYKAKLYNHPLEFGSVANRSLGVLILQYNHMRFLNWWNWPL